ncbi:zinc finger CCCH domain-containing protein 19-like [Wolffia australiana]
MSGFGDFELGGDLGQPLPWDEGAGGGREAVETIGSWVFQEKNVEELEGISGEKSMDSAGVLGLDGRGSVDEQVGIGPQEKEKVCEEKVEFLSMAGSGFDDEHGVLEKHQTEEEEEEEGSRKEADIFNVPSPVDQENALWEEERKEVETVFQGECTESHSIPVLPCVHGEFQGEGTKSHSTNVLPSVHGEFQGEGMQSHSIGVLPSVHGEFQGESMRSHSTRVAPTDHGDFQIEKGGAGFSCSAVDTAAESVIHRSIEENSRERKLLMEGVPDQGIWGFNNESVQPFDSTSLLTEGEIGSHYSLYVDKEAEEKMQVKPSMVEQVKDFGTQPIDRNAVESLEMVESAERVKMESDLKPTEGNDIKISESVEAELNPKILEDKDEGRDQFITSGEGLLAPLPFSNDFTDGDQEELYRSTMDAQETNESALEESSRRGGKKRGRPPKTQAGKAPAKKEEEDVCFICFDGGDLVVCDRRGCPKVYHPSCVNRDEAFFRSKGKWNCGWHICSICEKAAHYMCFTCTYSLCKSCIKDSQFVCVRGNKGLCETCRSTVMLIDTKEREEKKTDGVNFDDKGSWEYLFKDYWFDLKMKLSITLEEVSTAKNPWKGSSVRDEDQADEPYDAKEDHNSSSDSSSGHLRRSKPTKKKVKKSPKAPRSVEQKAALQLPDPDSEWASNELLEFVGHMRNGDKSVMCQFDVHTLLLEYIKQNNLRDPRRKSQIVCDARLETLFGKARVGHFEMLKLLESHFLAKEPSQVATDDNQGSVLDPESSQIDNEGNNNSATVGSDKKHKLRKKTGKGESQSNVDDYAAIDVHNINLLYLRRNLMEELLADPDVKEKVVGSFVRIRISGSGMRKDMYRLVPVIGTSRVEDKYKSGKKTTDIALEILNLSKTEVVSIDSISNQEFTEEECKRLRQSIKCGLINRLTVGGIQERALALRSVRINESLENEKQRLSHLRDRASEKGHRKELRECVEKLQRLNSPEERARRLNEIPAVHADPKMDPNYESDEEEFRNRRPESMSRSRDSSFSSRRRESTLPRKGIPPALDTFNDPHRGSGGYSDLNGVTMPNHHKEKLLLSPVAADPSLLTTGGLKSPKTPLAVNDNEKIWHYKDPSGKIQGPFSMTQLRKWNTTGYFPASLRIWRASEKEEDSILLTDALLGKFHREVASPKVGNSYQSPSQWRGEAAGPIQVSAWSPNSRVHSNSSGDGLTKYDEHMNVESRRSSYEQHQRYNFTSSEGARHSHPENPGQGRSSTSEQRSEWSMPSPTPTVEPSRYDPGKKPEQAMSQDTIVGPGSGPVSALTQGQGSAAWEALAQGNLGGAWVTTPLGNPSTATGWAPPPPPLPPPPPPPANPNMNNLLWMAQAQAQAYPGWTSSVQGPINLNAASAAAAAAGWLPGPPAAMPQIPNWVLPNQHGVPTPNPAWVVPSSDGNSGHNASWGAQQKMDGAGSASQPPLESERQGWNQAVPPGGGGAPRGHDASICRFFQQGHCRKGDSCNYRHYR